MSLLTHGSKAHRAVCGTIGGNESRSVRTQGSGGVTTGGGSVASLPHAGASTTRETRAGVARRSFRSRTARSLAQHGAIDLRAMSFDPNAPAQPGSGVFGLPHGESEALVVLVPVPWEATTSY